MKNETSESCGQTRKRIQNRDDDRHVAAADRKHEHRTKKKRSREEHPQRGNSASSRHDRDAENDHGKKDESVDNALQRKLKRLARQNFLQFSERDETSGK